jgi:tetratricopeptide (TPR) repeat protein
VLIAIAFIAALAAAGTMLWNRGRAKPLVKEPVTVPLGALLEKTRQRWSGGFAELKQDDPLKSLKQGEMDLARDTPSGYEEAAKAFQKSFLLESGNGQAIAGYLQAVAWGRGWLLENSEIEELINLAEAAELQWGKSPRILVAHASLALLGPQSSRSAERARSFAEQAVGLASGRDKALAHLVLSSAFLSSSAELAIQQTELALKLDPALRRSYFQRALARESVGDYALAISDLEQRLSLDADQWEARAALSRIYQEVGQLGLAYKVYEPAANSGNDLRAVTARALIQYQSERKARAAAQALGDRIRLREGEEQAPLLVEAWVHLASAERIAGRLESAANAAKQAIKLAPTDSAPHLQLFLIALARGSSEEASRHLALLKRRLADPALEKVLEGRLLLMQRRDAEAMRIFADAAQLDGRRVDALLLAGAAAASAGRRDDTLRYLLLAGQMDPTRIAPRPIPTRFYLGPEENLAGAEGRVVRLSKGYTDVTPRLYEALILFHQRNWAAADKLLRQVVDIDIGNALAHALRAMIALQRGSLRAALTSAERAVASGRGLALAHFAYATVLNRSGKLEAARKEFGQAESLAPALLAAQVSLAELDAKKKSTDAARRRLVHVLRVDPSYVAAKRALYNLER